MAERPGRSGGLSGPGGARAAHHDQTMRAVHVAGLYVIAAALLGAILTAIFTNGFGLFAASDHSVGAIRSVRPPAPGRTTASSSGTGTIPGGRLRTEIADVRAGIPVFSNNKGTAASVRNIPIRKRVLVRCKAPNDSGMSSINFFYLIETPPWRGDYASANSFSNGARIGVTTNSHPVDPKVPNCG